MSKSFDTIRRSTDDSAKSVLAFLAAMEGVKQIAKTKKGIAGIGAAAAVLTPGAVKGMIAQAKAEGTVAVQMLELLLQSAGIGRDIDNDGAVGPPGHKKVKDLTILSDGRAYTADKQDNLFLRSGDGGSPTGDTASVANLMEKMDTFIAAVTEAAQTPIVLQQTSDGTVVASTEHTIDFLSRRVIG